MSSKKTLDTLDTPLRAATKPVKFHRAGCTFPYSATCLCGQEPTYSPHARTSRGETAFTATFAEAYRRAREGLASPAPDGAPWGEGRGEMYDRANFQWRSGWSAGLAARAALKP